jgi:hypothetical protein
MGNIPPSPGKSENALGKRGNFKRRKKTNEGFSKNY